ncbi:MAG: DUF4403 family protein [Bacteroidota bacterium]
MYKIFDQFFLLTVAILTIQSCTLKSVTPSIITQEIPTPAVPTSDIQIPVEIDLQPLLTYANANTDWVIRNPEFPGFASFGGCDGPRANYDVNRDFLTGSILGNNFQIGTTAAYGIAGDYCTECVWETCIHPRLPFSCGTNGEAKRRVKIGFSTSLELTPEYGLKTQTTLSEISPLDPCELTFLKMNMTSEVMNAMRPSLEEGARYIDEQAKLTSFKSMADDAWKQMWTPMEIEGYGYLSLNPSDISVSALSGSGLNLKFNIGIQANPIFSVSKEKERAIPNLPPLKTNNTSQAGFTFHLPIVSSYEEITTKLATYFNQKEFLSEDKKQGIYIHNIQLSGKGNSTLVLEMNCNLKFGIKKFKNAKLIFTMKPQFNAETQTLELSEVSLQTDKKHVLLNAGTELFQKMICEKIKEAGKTDFKPLINENKQALNQQLNQKINEQTTLQGEVQEIKITGLFPTSDTLIIHTQATGKLNVKMSNYSFN